MDTIRMPRRAWLRVALRFAGRVALIVLGIVVAIGLVGWLSGWSALKDFAVALGGTGVAVVLMGLTSTVGNTYRSCAQTAQAGDRARFFAVAIGVGLACIALAWAVLQVAG